MLFHRYSLLFLWSSLAAGTSFWTAFLPVAVCRVGPSFAEGRMGFIKNQREATLACCYPDNFNEKLESKFMDRALELAAKGSGKTRPNPAVGCVVLDANGEVVGEGFHPKAGEPHAEVFALEAAGEKAEGGTAYVTLEPCNHHGRTPPCVDALLRAKVKRVVAGMVDPDPRTAGNGLKRLLANGVEVVEIPKTSKLGKACHILNTAFSHRILTGTVYGVVQCGLSETGVDHKRGLLLCSHPDFLECDGLLVEGNEGIVQLAACEETGVLPDTLVRVIIAENNDIELDSCSTWMKGAAQYIIVCTQGMIDPNVISKWQQQSFSVVQLEDLSVQEISSHFYHFGFLSMIWAVSPPRTQQVINLGFAQKVCIDIDQKASQKLTEVKKAEIIKVSSWLLGPKFDSRPESLNFLSIDNALLLEVLPQPCGEVVDW